MSIVPDLLRWPKGATGPMRPMLNSERLSLMAIPASLSSVVFAFQQCDSPVKIAHSFPTVTLAQVYGAVAYYLENEKLIQRSYRQSRA